MSRFDKRLSYFQLFFLGRGLELDFSVLSQNGYFSMVDVNPVSSALNIKQEILNNSYKLLKVSYKKMGNHLELPTLKQLCYKWSKNHLSKKADYYKDCMGFCFLFLISIKNKLSNQSILEKFNSLLTEDSFKLLFFCLALHPEKLVENAVNSRLSKRVSTDLELSVEAEKPNEKDLSLQNNRDRTALHAAILDGDVNVALDLIEKMTGEALSFQGDFGKTVLHRAVERSQEEIVLALTQKMPIDALSLQNNFGDTALHCAIASSYKHARIAIALINRMSEEDLSKKYVYEYGYSETLLIWTIRGGYDKLGTSQEIATHLINKITINSLSLQDSQGQTALYHAITFGRRKLALALVGRMSIEALSLLNDDDETALEKAIKKGSNKLVLLLSAIKGDMQKVAELVRNNDLNTWPDIHKVEVPFEWNGQCDRGTWLHAIIAKGMTANNQKVDEFLRNGGLGLFEEVQKKLNEEGGIRFLTEKDSREGSLKPGDFFPHEAYKKYKILKILQLTKGFFQKSARKL